VEEGRPKHRASRDAHVPDEAAPAHAGLHPHQAHRQLRPPLQVRDRQQGGIPSSAAVPPPFLVPDLCVRGFARF
jgi:hypothetical protein